MSKRAEQKAARLTQLRAAGLAYLKIGFPHIEMNGRNSLIGIPLEKWGRLAREKRTRGAK